MAQFEYLSPEWAEEATRRLQADLTPEKMKHLTSSMLTIYTNCPFPYWTNPDHVYQAGEMLSCAMQYACPEEEIGFRYENPILITGNGCEVMSKFPLAIEEI